MQDEFLVSVVQRFTGCMFTLLHDCNYVYFSKWVCSSFNLYGIFLFPFLFLFLSISVFHLVCFIVLLPFFFWIGRSTIKQTGWNIVLLTVIMEFLTILTRLTYFLNYGSVFWFPHVAHCPLFFCLEFLSFVTFSFACLTCLLLPNLYCGYWKLIW